MSQKNREYCVSLIASQNPHNKNNGTIVLDGPIYRQTARAILTGKAVKLGGFLLKFPSRRDERNARNSVLAPARLGLALPVERTFSLVPLFSREGREILKTAKIEAPAHAARARARTRRVEFKGGQHPSFT